MKSALWRISIYLNIFSLKIIFGGGIWVSPQPAVILEIPFVVEWRIVEVLDIKVWAM